MTRLLVLATALLFLLGFGFLTFASVAEQGLTAEAVVSILILVVLTVGIVGAILGRPRDPPR